MDSARRTNRGGLSNFASAPRHTYTLILKKALIMAETEKREPFNNPDVEPRRPARENPVPIYEPPPSPPDRSPKEPPTIEPPQKKPPDVHS